MTVTGQAQQQSSLNFVQSKNMVKNTIRLSLSTVCYIRNLFREEAFKERLYCDVKMKVLKPRTDNSGNLVDRDAQQAILWLEEGAFKAMDKGYLQRILFCIYDKDPNKDKCANVLECYTFKVSQEQNICVDVTKGDGQNNNLQVAPNPSASSKDELRRDMQHLVRRLIAATNVLEPLPEFTWLAMQLTYTTDTPKEYQPTHFQEKTTAKLAKFKTEPKTYKMGTLHSNFHNLVVKIRTQERGSAESSRKPDDATTDADSDQSEDFVDEDHTKQIKNRNQSRHRDDRVLQEPLRNLSLGDQNATRSKRNQHPATFSQDSVFTFQENNPPDRKYSTSKRSLRVRPLQDVTGNKASNTARAKRRRG